jgi:hypothetical protein
MTSMKQHTLLYHRRSPNMTKHFLLALSSVNGGVDKHRLFLRLVWRVA